MARHKRKGFTMIQDVVLENGFLMGKSAQMVFGILAKHADNETGRCFPSIELITEYTGMHRTTVMKGISKLEKLGLIDVLRGKRAGAKTCANNYVVNWEWKPPRPKAEIQGSDKATTNEIPVVGLNDISSRTIRH